VDVEVFAERSRDPDNCHKVTEATLTYVALDEKGKPTAVEG
jgi:acyl-CoA thioesterase YciA